MTKRLSELTPEGKHRFEELRKKYAPQPTPKPVKTTKQGVRDLGAGNRSNHDHRYAPATFINRSGFQVTRMQCFCGVDQTESDDERSMREELERTAALDSIYG